MEKLGCQEPFFRSVPNIPLPPVAVDFEPVGAARGEVAAGVEVALPEDVVQVERINSREGVAGVEVVVVPGRWVRMDEEHDVGKTGVIFEDVG